MEFSKAKKRSKSLVIIGGRPQIIKVMPLFERYPLHIKKIELILINTGQHYSKELSDDFFREFKLPRAKYNLNCQKDTPSNQIAKIISRLEKIILQEQPDSAVIFGDMNSTLAGAIACSKNNIPIIHVEAGTRSFNREMSEENNRVITDRLSSILLAPDSDALKNLNNELVFRNSRTSPPKIIYSGDIMHETLMLINKKGLIKKSKSEKYCLVTIHRAENVSKKRLKEIFNFLAKLNMKMIFPIHPRTKLAVRKYTLTVPKNIQVVKPVGYVEIINLANNSEMVFTDSGGLQKEACWLGKPCIILRNETEKPSIVKNKQAVFYKNYSSLFRFKCHRSTAQTNASKYLIEAIKSLAKQKC